MVNQTQLDETTDLLRLLLFLLCLLWPIIEAIKRRIGSELCILLNLSNNSNRHQRYREPEGNHSNNAHFTIKKKRNGVKCLQALKGESSFLLTSVLSDALLFVLQW